MEFPFHEPVFEIDFRTASSGPSRWAGRHRQSKQPAAPSGDNGRDVDHPPGRSNETWLNMTSLQYSIGSSKRTYGIATIFLVSKRHVGEPLRWSEVAVTSGRVRQACEHCQAHVCLRDRTSVNLHGSS